MGREGEQKAIGYSPSFLVALEEQTGVKPLEVGDVIPLDKPHLFHPEFGAMELPVFSWELKDRIKAGYEGHDGTMKVTSLTGDELGAVASCTVEGCSFSTSYNRIA